MKKKIVLTMGGTILMAGVTYFVWKAVKLIGRDDQQACAKEYESIDERDVAWG